jgi:AmmeMemoRadiSam system protein A
MTTAPHNHSAILDAADRRAHEAIRHGLVHGHHLPVALESYSAGLRSPGSSFVTLKSGGELRGCVGSLEAGQPLAADVAKNAHAAAFNDPRFRPLTGAEYSRLSVSIALLSPAVVLECVSEAELVAALRPGIDGLILTEGHTHRATFLPAVWQSLSEPEEFVRQLKIKAGLAPHYWSATLCFMRYTTETIT